MSFDNTKYHVELNGVGYQISGYRKAELPPFIPRLGAGDQKESQFDVLRSETLKEFSGGNLQRYWNDDTSFYGSTSMFPIYDDGTLYPVSAFTEAKELFTSTKCKVTAWMVMSNKVYVAWRLYNSTNAMGRLNSDGSVTSISLPANMSNTARSIVSIVRDSSTKIWVTCDDGLTMGYLSDGSDTSVAEIGSGTSTPCIAQAIMFRGQLYGLDGNQGSESNQILYRHTGSTSSRTKVEVGRTHGSWNDPNAKIIEYNNRLLLFTNRGLWSYDGIQFVAIENTGTMASNENYRFPAILRGYVYFWMTDGLYRFNGALIEKMYDVNEIGYPTAVCIGANRLWYAFSNSSAIRSSRYDKSMGYDYSAGDTVNGHIKCFDGKGMFEYARTADWTQASADFTGQGEVSDMFWQFDKIWLFSNYDKIGTGDSGTNRYYTVPTNETANSGNKTFTLVTSIFDADFPMIDKNLENVELLLDGYIPSDQSITLSYRVIGFDGSTAFTSLGTIKTQSELKRYVWKTITAGVTFRQLQLKLTSSAMDCRVGIRKVIMRYTLSPVPKWQWQMNIEAQGDNVLEPLVLADGTEGSQAVATLRGNIYASRYSDQPVQFIDVDQLDLNEALDNSETEITLNSTVLLTGEDGFIKIDDEIIYWYGSKTSTSLATVVRGVLGSSAASHNDNSKVFILYRVLLEIQGEHIELVENETDAVEDKSRPSSIAVLLREV